MDEQVKHICNEVGIPRKSRLKMEEFGLCSIQDLSGVRDRIQRRELDDLREEVREKLLAVAEWRTKNPNADIIEDFDEDVYDKLYKVQRYAELYIRTALGQPYQEDFIPHFMDVKEDNVLLDAVVNKSKDIIMESSNLRNMCGKFDYNSFLDKAIRHFHALVGQENDILEKLFIIAGRTQAGKTSVKGVIQSLCGLLKIPLVVLTKGVDESIDLHVKLLRLSAGTSIQEKHIVVASSKNDGMGYRLKDARVCEALEGGSHGGTLVIADTKPQVINKACKAIKKYREQIPGGKFVLIVDEADAMFRTKDKHQVFEQALQQLIDLKPSMTVMISATPVPFMLELVHGMDSSAENIQFFNLEPQDDYVGIEDIKPLEIDGKKIDLDQNELTSRSTFASDGVTICCANDKNIALYDDALSDLENRKGILVLDCSCPRVYARSNIKDKATAVQKLYQKRGKQTIVVTFSGKGIAVKVPNKAWDHERWRKSLIGQLLEHIDEQYGLDIPVFIFGYTKMCRGVSFRSSNRVPTHMIMALGRGHNISTIVQTLGRATFNGSNLLQDNGFDCIRVLTTSNDYTTCVKKQNYINQVAHRIQLGDDFPAAVTGANEKMADSANFLRHTFREIGRVKGMRKQFEDWVDFDDVPKELSPDEEETKEKFWSNTDAQILLRSLARLRKGHALVHPDDIIDDLNEAEHYSMDKKKMRALLIKFRDKSLISKDKDSLIKVPTVDRLIPFMNPEEGEIPDLLEEDEESIGSEDGGSINELSSVGSKESPIILDLGDDEFSASLSSVSMTTTSNLDRAGLSNTKVVSPEKNDESMHFVGQRVAKSFSLVVYFGSVVQYCGDKELWSIKYDDGDDEEFDKDDICQALCLYKTHQQNDHLKPPSLIEASSALTSIEDIPMVPESDKSKSMTCIEQPEKKRRVYYTGKADTPFKIAKRLNVDVDRIIRDNKRREGYTKLSKRSRFSFNSPIVVPLEATHEEA
ncbi:hypothetical protein ACHAXR_010249 [Thalassiosira sp. AJA248-18]